MRVNPGDRINMVTILEFDHRDHGLTYWKCRCDCGKEFIFCNRYIQQGYPKSCGCTNRYGPKSFTYKGRTMSKKGWAQHLGCTTAAFNRHLSKCEERG